MSSLCVLEYVRDPDGVWSLPRPLVSALAREFPAVRFVSPADMDDVDRALPEADVVLGWAVRPHNLERAARLRWIQVTAASVSGLLFPALVASDVVVTNGRGLHADAIAEHTLGVLLAFARKLHLARDAQRERRWTSRELVTQTPPMGALAGSTLGLVGFGAIGRALAVRAAALGMRVLAVRRRPESDPAPAHAQWGLERLPELLALADGVVVAAPLTAETKGMVGRDALAHMRPNAVLVNVGRGALVDEAALVDALRKGRLAGAGLDVFEREPLPPGSPLWEMPNVILTPHVSGYGPCLWERAMELFARNLRAYLAGQPLENVVDKAAGY